MSPPHPSHRPDLPQLQLQRQALRQLTAIQPADVFQSFSHRLLAAPPDLHRPLVGKKQPAEAGAVGLVEVHLAAQGRYGAGAFIGDFFDLKKLNGYDPETMQAVIRCYQSLIALSDCDGFRIDAAKHLPKSLCQQFCFAIYRYAQSIGKANFLLVGEITDNVISINYLSLFGSIF